MSITTRRTRFAVFAAVAALGVLNALAWWGESTAWTVFAIMESIVCIAVLVYGTITGLRARGLGRVWRLMIVVAMALFYLCGELIWWIGPGEARPLMAAGYFLGTGLAMLALVVIIRYAGPVIEPPGESRRHLVVTTVIDGAVAAASFAVVVALGGFGSNTASLPRSGNAAIELAYAGLVMVAVAYAAAFAMTYGPGKPYRFNFMTLSGGLVMTTASDRLMGYFDAIGVPAGMLWSQIGFVLGPLLIAFSMEDVHESDPRPKYASLSTRQTLLPYAGFFAVQTLLAFHVLTGHGLGPVEVAVAMVMIGLVTLRQAVAVDAERKLTARLYDTQLRLTHQVYHDALTGLPNRLLFSKHLDEAMDRGEFVLIFVDIDDFKEVNDRYGHVAGDELLRAVGDRLKDSMSDGDTLARIGGDEYAILTRTPIEDVELVADRLRVALREPFAVQGFSVRVKASMGLVHSGAGGPSPSSDDLLRQADISMYTGKRLGKNTAVVYDPAERVRSDFPTALRASAGEVPAGFRLLYQPVVSLTDGSLVAVEALARWTAPNGMAIPPETFVAAAETAGLGARLDELVLDLACCEVMASGLEVDVHVNVGAGRLGSSGFEHHVRRVCERHALPSRRLVLEITETLPIVDLADAAAQIERFRDVGVKVALDDFGAGYNSLTYLHALPVHIVKLDRSLAVGAEPERDFTLYRSVIGLCNELQLDVIAEGIETTVQAGTILAAGCRLAQGHLFGRPATLSDIRREWQDAAATADQGEHLRAPTSFVNGAS
ncbi:putative bifunctional diguanylate cyclase/phosphodiesterase [Mycobacterium sp. SMC-4]|uniref:putative bifunctional diguanylate cyclase/phosphodiesterase n=1 Tax=Mycobacterium sp. SMC-4 TaxID=2857059 RepID=UPI003CFCA253